MYKFVFRELDLACQDLPFEVSADGPPDGTGRFDHFINDLLKKAGTRVALVVDHLDSVPHFFGRSLVRRFRLMVDQEDLHPEFKNLCLLLAGRTSLFDLRRTGDSAFVASNLIFPRVSEPEWSKHLQMNGAPNNSIIDRLREETGGEAIFVDLLFSELKEFPRLSPRKIDAAIEALLNSPQRHDLFHQIALEIASNLDLKNLVHDLLASKGGRLVRRDSSPDVDPFCLSGAVVLKREQSFSCYRFRNGIIEKFSKRLLSDATTKSPYLPGLAELNAVRAVCTQSRDIYSGVKSLLDCWKNCVFGIQPPIASYLHVHFLDTELETWLDIGRRRQLDLSENEPVLVSALRSVQLSNQTSPRNATFGFDEQTVSYSIPFARPEASLELVLSFEGQFVSGLNENSLSHWLRLLDDCWAWLAVSALAEVSHNFAQRSKATQSRIAAIPALVSDVRIHWIDSEGLLVDAPDECVYYPIERSPQQIKNTLDDMNQRCLRLMEQDRSADNFNAELRGLADQMLNFFQHCPDFSRHLQISKGPFTFISDESGLRIPIELFPVNASYVGIERQIVRRLRNLVQRSGQMQFATCIRGLIERGEPLKVLLAGADPRNSLENLDEELTRLSESVKEGCVAVGLRTIVTLLKPINGTQAALMSLLQDRNLGPFHIFHFCGHGRRGRNPDESSIILRGTRGEDDPVSCEKLRLMVQDNVLWMAYLSCCYGAAVRGSSGIEQQYVGTIQAVLAAGIGTVVGFRWAVTDLGAYMLANSFYKHLFSRETSFNPSRAMWEARKSVAGDEDKRDAWASSLMVSQFG
jgi:hypothetical protein